MPEAANSYRFSFGPWNISEGADPFGPPVRDPLTFMEKVTIAKKLGFDALQKQEVAAKHLANSKQTFLWLLDEVRSLDRKLHAELIKQRDYEELSRYVTAHLLGVKY